MPRKTPPKHPHRHAIGSSVMDGNGYPTALTPERHRRLIEELRRGDWPATAAIRADCSPRTVERWVVMGCQYGAVDPYASFAADYVKVEAELVGELTGIIMDKIRGKGRKGDKRSAEWAERWLQLRFRYLFGAGPTSIQGGVSATQLVFEALDKADSDHAQKAREYLKQLPEAAKQVARKEGFAL